MTEIAPHKTVERCRSCENSSFHDLHAFGLTPIADRLGAPGDTVSDLRAPLTFAICKSCGLAQIKETVEPRFLFHEEYPYYSSVSPALLAHFRASAEALISKAKLDQSSLVVEAASNDGYMLRRFRESGIGVLGIDPSDGPVEVARSHGIDTIHGFFTKAMAEKIVGAGRKADVFLANNVLAHVADTNDFVAGISKILSDDGIAVIEFPYLLDLVENCAFDTIYHQHLLYLSLTSVKAFAERYGLWLNDVERIPVHGGSVRVTLSRKNNKSPELERLLEAETELGVGSPEFFEPFLYRMSVLRTEFKDLLTAYQQQNKRIAAYGAAAKATTLLHHFGVQSTDLEFIIDKSPWKQGLEMPGTRIPIVSPDVLKSEAVDVLVILAWNFANEIMNENVAFSDGGGEFVVPVPELVIANGQVMRAAL